MYVNEVGNDVAAKAIDVASNYIKRNPNLGVSVEIISVEGNRTDSKGLLEASKSLYRYLPFKNDKNVNYFWNFAG